MKKSNKVVVIALTVAMMIAVAPAAFAASVTHLVSIVVNPTLSMTANTAAFTLTFPDYLQGTASNTQDVVYTVKANNVVNAAPVSAKLDTLFPNVDLNAVPGAYTQVSGNGILVPTAGGTITTNGITLMNHTIANGTSGKTVRGSFPVTYQAKANADLDPLTDSLQRTLTVTFADN